MPSSIALLLFSSRQRSNSASLMPVCFHRFMIPPFMSHSRQAHLSKVVKTAPTKEKYLSLPAQRASAEIEKATESPGNSRRM